MPTIIEQGKELDKQMGRAVSWLKNSDVGTEALIKQLNNERRSVSKMSKSLESNNVFSVFGASQVGKSYLVKNLLSVDNTSLKIDLGNDDLVDFINEVNPPGGGKESTGIVSRFTIDQVKNNNYPVELKLLSVKDLILIFCCSAFKQINGWSPLNRDEIIREKSKIEENDWEQISNQIVIDEFEIVEIKDALEMEYPEYSDLWNHLNELGFWDYLLNNLNAICKSQDHFSTLFSIIWKNSNHLNSLFDQLLTACFELKFESCVFVKKEAILNADGALLNAGSVINMNDPREEGKMIEVFSSSQNTSYSLHRGCLSALSKEIVLTIEKKVADKRDFLNRTDFMDFPGARSHIQIEASSNLTDNLSAADIYLRGKVSYLFDKYSEDYEINNLLFCVPCQKNEVTHLPGLLSSWINRNIGARSEDRASKLSQLKTSPLMVIFTWWNVELKPHESDVHGFDEQWERRFETFFKSEMVQDNTWYLNWSKEQSKFSDFFLLRDFDCSKLGSAVGGGLFSGYDTETGSPESAYVKDIPHMSDAFTQRFGNVEEYMTTMRDSFLEYDFVKENFDNPKHVWNETSTIGKDGSELIANQLNIASQESSKTRNAIQIFKKAKDKYIEVLNNHKRDDDPKMQLSSMKSLIAVLRREFTPLIQHKSSLIYSLQQKFTANFSEVYPIVSNSTTITQVNQSHDIEMFIATHPFINLEMSLTEIEDALMSYYSKNDRNDLRIYIREQYSLELKTIVNTEVLDDNSTWVVNVINQLADLKFSQSYGYDDIIKSGLDGDLLMRLLEQFKNGVVNRRVAALIDQELSHINGILIGNDNNAWIAKLICKWWNEFVFECDDRFYSSKEIEFLSDFEKRYYSLDNFKREVIEYNDAFKKIDELFGQKPKAELPIIQVLPGISKLNSWIKGIERMLIMNCGGDAFDQENQEELVEIFEAINCMNINENIQ